MSFSKGGSYVGIWETGEKVSPIFSNEVEVVLWAERHCKDSNNRQFTLRNLGESNDGCMYYNGDRVGFF